MKRRSWLLGAVTCLAASAATAEERGSSPRPGPRARDTLLPGTRFATAWYELHAARPGPRVLVVAGIHGNEQAPPHAARQLLGWSLGRGHVAVVPAANPPALASRTRFSPRTSWLDLNRCFPIPGRPDPVGAPATELWRRAVAFRPDWVLDLHEGYAIRRLDPRSVGSTVVYVPDPRTESLTRPLAERIVAAVNATIANPRRRFLLHQPGPLGSLARSFTDCHAVPSLVFETTWVAQPHELRVAQQLTMLHTAFAALGMLRRPPRGGGTLTPPTAGRATASNRRC